MSQQLIHTMFYDVLFPEEHNSMHFDDARLSLRKVIKYSPSSDIEIKQTTLVIFDFETTGLDSGSDRIIEIGGVKVREGRIVDQFDTLVKPPIALPLEATKITGITEEMLIGRPPAGQVMPEFLKFIDGAVLVAHNADFDMAFLVNECERLGYQINWPCFCTLKLARALLPDLNSKSLDCLAEHYGFKFEEGRHRSIGDCKVTSAVLMAILENEGSSLRFLRDFGPFMVVEKK
ncbi:MAG: 3'-5' exonuclease [Oligoflexales bacterium]|nr:3'-5' exonuclease [Oligoflexales bacterium]